MPKCSFFLYYGNVCFHTVWLEENATDEEIIRKAIRETNEVPGVVCDYPNEAPCEHLTKIKYSTIRRYCENKQ